MKRWRIWKRNPVLKRVSWLSLRYACVCRVKTGLPTEQRQAGRRVRLGLVRLVATPVLFTAAAGRSRYICCRSRPPLHGLVQCHIFYSHFIYFFPLVIFIVKCKLPTKVDNDLYFHVRTLITTVGQMWIVELMRKKRPSCTGFVVQLNLGTGAVTTATVDPKDYNQTHATPAERINLAHRAVFCSGLQFCHA